MLSHGLMKRGYLNYMLCIGPARSKLEDHLAVHSKQHVDMIARAPYLLPQTEMNDLFKQFRDVYICKESELPAFLRKKRRVEDQEIKSIL